MTADPRPRYRVHATRWYDHGPGDLGHEPGCAAGWELEIFALQVDEYYPPERKLGVTQTVGGETFNVPVVRALVTDYLRTLAEPHVISVLPSQILLLVETP